MNAVANVLDSRSVGDPACFAALDELERAFSQLPSAPRDVGRVAVIVRRGDGGRREILDRVVMTPDGGMAGDAWGRQRRSGPDAQLAVMQVGVAELVANGQPLALFGDNLFIDLDLSSGNLPAGSRLHAGGVVLEVTPEPHTGCAKFRMRFGGDALRFVSAKPLQSFNLRGIYLRCVSGGELSVGDRIDVMSRGRR